MNISETTYIDSMCQEKKEEEDLLAFKRASDKKTTLKCVEEEWLQRLENNTDNTSLNGTKQRKTMAQEYNFVKSKSREDVTILQM